MAEGPHRAGLPGLGPHDRDGVHGATPRDPLFFPTWVVGEFRPVITDDSGCCLHNAATFPRPARSRMIRAGRPRRATWAWRSSDRAGPTSRDQCGGGSERTCGFGHRVPLYSFLGAGQALAEWRPLKRPPQQLTRVVGQLPRENDLLKLCMQPRHMLTYKPALTWF